MKRNKMMLACAMAGVMVGCVACTNAKHNAKVPTLLITEGWTADTLDAGLVLYSFSGLDECSNAEQNVNVLEVDLDNPAYRLKFEYLEGSDTTSAVMNRVESSVAAVNSCYEPEAVYIKVDGDVKSEVTLAPDHLRFWKHEAGFYCTNGNDVGIVFAGKDGADAIALYKGLEAENIFSGTPMLVDNFDPVGERFVDPSLTQEDFASFNYEDARRHQGVRHPRTAYALTEDNDLLLITVDGRRSWSSGMSAAELTRFIVKYFNPQYAINMDGGGSTTLCVKGRGQESTNVVNYPTDKGREDHFGQRRISTFLVVVKDEK